MSTSLDDWKTFRRAGEAGRMQVRLMVYLLDDPVRMKDGFDPLTTTPSDQWMYGDRLRAVGVKFFADGALGSRGAWLKQPYADKPNSIGNRLHSDADLRSLEQSGVARFPNCDARDRRCRQRPSNQHLRVAQRRTWPQPPLADRACAGRGLRRPAAHRARAHDCLDAADA